MAPAAATWVRTAAALIEAVDHAIALAPISAAGSPPNPIVELLGVRP
jgi:hypothetical protein